jgi:hypothetical protein
MAKQTQQGAILPGPSTRDLRVLCDCGTVVLATVVVVVDAAAEPELLAKLLDGQLNTADCPTCETSHDLSPPVVLHHRLSKSIHLVLSEGSRHRALAELADYIRSLEAAGGGDTLPEYMLRPHLVPGSAGLGAALEAHEARSAARADAEAAAGGLEQATADLEQRVQAINMREQALDEARDALDADGRSSDERTRDLEQQLADQGARDEQLARRESEMAALEAAISAREGEVEARGSSARGAEEGLGERELSLDERQAALDEREAALGEGEAALDSMRRGLEEQAGELAARQASPTVVTRSKVPPEADPEAAEAEAEPAEDAYPDIDDRPSEEHSVVEVDIAAEPADEVDPEPPGDEESDVDTVITTLPAEADAAEGEESAKGVDEGDEGEEEWSEGLDEAWDLDFAAVGEGEEGAPAEECSNTLDTGKRKDIAATRRVDHPNGRARREASDVEVITRGPDAGPFEEFDTQAGQGTPRYLVVEGGEVYLCHKVPAAELDEILGRSTLDLRLQMHRVDDDAVFAMLLVAPGTDGADEELLHWLMDHEEDLDGEAIGLLAQSFRPVVVLFDGDNRPRKAIPFERPLEDNVRAAVDAATAWRASRETADWHTAAAQVAADGFDRLGGMEHPFHRDAFTRLESPGHVRFALGILDYWSREENRDYLSFVKSFPMEEFRVILRRALSTSVEFGIALTDGLAEMAIDLGVVPTRRELVRGALASFAEVALRLKPNDLDEVAQWENWQALLEQAEARGVPVDPSILQLAERAMERVRQMVEGAAPEGQAEPEAEPAREAPEVDAEADAEEDGLDSTADLIDDSEIVVAPLEERSDGDLVALLDDDELAAEAGRVLRERGGAGVAAALVTRVAKGEGAGRSYAVDTLGGLGGDAFKAVRDGIQGLTRGDKSVDDALAAMVAVVGRGNVEKLKKHRSRKLRDAARRVLKRGGKAN